MSTYVEAYWGYHIVRAMGWYYVLLNAGDTIDLAVEKFSTIEATRIAIEDWHACFNKEAA